MAFTRYHNIVGGSNPSVELLAPGDNAGNIDSIILTNRHATNDATVSLFVHKLSSAINNNASESYYIISTVAIPSDTSLLLDDSSLLSFDNSLSGYSLFITVAGGDTVDVIINPS